MLKKVFRIIWIAISTIVALVIIAVVVIWANREKIIHHFTEEVQKTLNTDVHVKSMEVSLLEHFPNVSIDINDVFIKEAIAGSNDTLLFAQRLELSFSLFDIIKENYKVRSVYLTGASLKLYWDEQGKNNFTIYKSDSTSDSSSSIFNFELDKIVIESTDLVYINKTTKQHHHLFIGEVESDLSWKKNILNLDLDGDLLVYQIGLGKDTYFKEKHVDLSTALSYNVDKAHFLLTHCNLEVEKALFKVAGTLNHKKENAVDLSIEASKSDIQTIISILPNRIYKLIKNYKSRGDVYFKGTINGIASETSSPKIDISFGFEDITFYHPESNQEITNAYLKGTYTNGSKQNLSTSKIALNNFTGNLSGQEIKGHFTYNNFNDPYIEFFINGAFDAKQLFSFIPDAGIHPTQGNLSINLFFSGRQKHLKSKDGAQHLKTSGQLFMSDFSFTIDNSNLAFNKLNGSFLFDKNDLMINGFQGEIGQSDFQLNGFFHNVISYLLLEEETLGVAADFYADYINLDELLSQESENKLNQSAINTSNKTSEFRIPPSFSFQLNCAIDSLKFQNLSGDNIGQNLKGSIDLQYQSILFREVHFSTAGGNIHLEDGFLEARDHHDMHFQTSGTVGQIDVERALLILNNFDQDFLTADNLKGTLSGTFDVDLEMTHALDVRMPTIEANLNFQVDNGQLIDFDPMIELGLFLKKKKFKRYLKDDNLSQISFSRLNENIIIKNSKIEIPFMEIKSSVTDMTISGTHHFNTEFAYRLSFPLINYNRRDRLEQRGVQRNKKNNEIEVHLNILGNNDDFEVDFLQKETSKSIFNVAQDQFNEDGQTEEVGIDTTQTLSDEEEETFDNFFNE